MWVLAILRECSPLYRVELPTHTGGTARRNYARNCNKTFLCDKCRNKEEDCPCSVNEGDQGWISCSESECESEDGGKGEHQATAENTKLQQQTGEGNSHKHRTPEPSTKQEQRKTSVQQLTERFEHRKNSNLIARIKSRPFYPGSVWRCGSGLLGRKGGRCSQ